MNIEVKFNHENKKNIRLIDKDHNYPIITESGVDDDIISSHDIDEESEKIPEIN